MTKDYAHVLLGDAATSGMAVAVHAATKPEENAVVDRNGSHSWLELNNRVNQVARLIRSAGLGNNPEDSIALLCSNRVEFVEIFIAAFRVGVRITPINWHLSAEEMGYILDNCDAQLFFADDLPRLPAGKILRRVVRDPYWEGRDKSI